MLADRLARKGLLAALLADANSLRRGDLDGRGLLKSDSPQGNVRFGPPQHALRFLFTQLWPEAEADSASR